jgi:hypothetical protein
MGPITRAKPAPSLAIKRAVGAPVLLLSALFMVPFLAGYAVYGVTAVAIRSLANLPKTLVGMVDYAGEVILGR